MDQSANTGREDKQPKLIGGKQLAEVLILTVLLVVSADVFGSGWSIVGALAAAGVFFTAIVFAAIAINLIRRRRWRQRRE